MNNTKLSIKIEKANIKDIDALSAISVRRNKECNQEQHLIDSTDFLY